MTPRNTKTPEQRKKIAEAYRQGIETRDIRSRFRVSWTVLYSILQEFDIPKRKGRPGAP